MQTDPVAPGAPSQDVSVFGVFLLSMFSVGLAILGMLALGLTVVALWWLISHIPLPPFVWRVLAHLGL
jgi:hypothetical protein